MIQYIKTVEDKEKRQFLAEGMVDMMLQMSTNERKTQEYSDKMWTHMLKIADYELDVEVPEGVELTRPAPIVKEKMKVEYPKPIRRYRHYGQYIQDLINKALAMEDGPKKQEFVRIIGSYMKTAYKQWNRNHYINDESVLEDIKIITKGELSISDDASFDYLKNARRSNSQSKDRRNKSSRNSGSSNYKKNKGKQYKKRKPTH
jgi:hypothetical protein